MIIHLCSGMLQFSSVAQSCPTFCNPMNRSTPGLPVHHHSQSPPKPMSIGLVMPSNHLILCHLLLLLPSIFPSIRVFLNESALHIRWPKYWSSASFFFFFLVLDVTILFQWKGDFWILELLGKISQPYRDGNRKFQAEGGTGKDLKREWAWYILGTKGVFHICNGE